MINISKEQVKIFDILNDMNRQEVWQTMHVLLTVLTVKNIKESNYDKFLDVFKELALQKDIKESNYDKFLDVFKNLALTQAKDFKQFVDKEKTHGHA